MSGVQDKTTDLSALLEQAVAAEAALAPQIRAERARRARRGYIRAEMGFGSDADEAEYSAALAAGDTVTLARLDAEAKERMRRADEIMDRMGL